MGCDTNKDTVRCVDCVSIHAPTWGATNRELRQDFTGVVSIHAPTWGATKPISSASAAMLFQSTHPHGVRQPGKTGQNRPKKFQSTHPHGVRLRRRRRGGRGSPVSIHAPTWGATDAIASPSPAKAVSIHAPTWGATTFLFYHTGIRQFQSTHPHGVRLGLHRVYHKPASFNPRTHVGCDIEIIEPISICKVSIHAPTWGATEIYLLKNLHQRFQSTHPRGVRQIPFVVVHADILFQSTHPRGCVD